VCGGSGGHLAPERPQLRLRVLRDRVEERRQDLPARRVLAGEELQQQESGRAGPAARRGRVPRGGCGHVREREREQQLRL